MSVCDSYLVLFYYLRLMCSWCFLYLWVCCQKFQQLQALFFSFFFKKSKSASFIFEEKENKDVSGLLSTISSELQVIVQKLTGK